MTWWNTKHFPYPQEQVSEDTADLRPHIHAPDLTEERIQRSSKLFESVMVQPLQLGEQEQEDGGPGITVGLASQGQEVGDNLQIMKM